MSKLSKPLPAMPIWAIMYLDEPVLQRAIESLTDKLHWQLPDQWSEQYLFSEFSHYYDDEMGSDRIMKQLFAFPFLVERDSLIEIKKRAVEVEEEFVTIHKKRRINIDPGLLSRENFILATGKNFTHRIYLGQGVFADLTLIYTKEKFQRLAWTYKDYLLEIVQKFLLKQRGRYNKILKNALK